MRGRSGNRTCPDTGCSRSSPGVRPENAGSWAVSSSSRVTDPVACAGEGEGALDRFAGHGFEVEGGVGDEDGRAEGRGRRARRLDFTRRVVGLRQGLSFSDSARIVASARVLGLRCLALWNRARSGENEIVFIETTSKILIFTQIFLYVMLSTKG